MLPEGKLAIQAVRAEFAWKPARRVEPLVDYEPGGRDIGVADLADLQLWTATYEDEVVVLTSADGKVRPTISVPGITRLSLSFDQSMRPVIAYTNDAGSFMYWFNSQTNVEETMPIDGGYLRVAADENREAFLVNRDVLLSYVRDGILYYRVQRERFQLEHKLADVPGSTLVAFGMSVNNRMQWRLTPQP